MLQNYILYFIHILITTSLYQSKFQNSRQSSTIQLNNNNFNEAYCTVQSLQSTPIRIYPISKKQIKNLVNKPYILSKFNLKKHEYIDTNYKNAELDKYQQNIINMINTPSEVFQQNRVIVDNCNLLIQRQFKITIVNPTNNFKFCVMDVFIDNPDIKRIQTRKIPFCINRRTKFPIFLKVFIQEMKAKVIKSFIFFSVQIIDFTNGFLIEQKIWVKQVVITVQNNWLKLNKVEIIQQDNETYSLQLSNQFDHQLSLEMSSSLILFSQTCRTNDKKNFVLKIKPHQSTKIFLENKNGLITINGTLGKSHNFDLIKILINPVSKFKIDNINIGVICSKRNSAETLITVTNLYNFSVFIDQIEVTNKLRTAKLLPLQNSTNEVPALATNFPVAILRVYSSSKQEEIAKIKIKIKYNCQGQYDLKVETDFNYAQITNPISNIEKRFIYLENPPIKKKYQDSILSLKNSLNLPIKVTQVYYNQSKFKITFLSQNRQLIYPNQDSFVFHLDYISKDSLLLPSTTEIMLFQFNHNLLIPVEVIIYDKTLQCTFQNITKRCNLTKQIDFGQLKTGGKNYRDIVVKNSNPSPIKLTMTIKKISKHTKIAVLGPSPGIDEAWNQFESTVNYFLKVRNSILIRFQINSTKIVNSSEIISFSTLEQSFTIEFKYKISNGSFLFFPNPLIISNKNYDVINEHIYFKSTFAEQYSVKIVEKTLPIIFNYSNNDIIQPNQIKALNFKYNPFDKSEKCCELTNLVRSIERFKTQKKQNRVSGTVTIRTSNDLEQSVKIIIQNFKYNLIEKKQLNYEIVQDSRANQYKIKIVNNYPDKYIKYRIILIDNTLLQYPAEIKNNVYKMNQKSSVYICLSEQVKQKLKFTPQVLKALLRMDIYPDELFIEPLQMNNQFYVQKPYNTDQKINRQKLEYEMTKNLVNSIIAGSRYCYKFQGPLYFKELFSTKTFMKVIQNEQSNTIFQFIEKEHENYREHKYYLEFDHFYQNIRMDDSEILEDTYCYFRFCTYTPLFYEINHENILQKNSSENFTISLVQNNYTQIKACTLLILNNVTNVEIYPISFKISKSLLKIQSILLYNLTFTRDDFYNQYLDLKSYAQAERILPIYITYQDYINGQLRGSRSYFLKNYGENIIKIQKIGFEDQSESCSYKGLQITPCNPFEIKPKQGYTLTIDFKFHNIINNNPIKLFLYSSNHHYRLLLVTRAKDIHKLKSSEPEYIYVLVSLASIVFILSVILLVKNQRVNNQVITKVKPNYDKKNFGVPIIKQPKPSLKLSSIYISKCMMENKLKIVKSINNKKELDQKSYYQSQQNRQLHQVKDQVSSFDDIKSEFRKKDIQSMSESNDVSLCSEENLNKKSDSDSFSSGSSVSQDLLRQINKYTDFGFGRIDRNSNSDQNQSQDNKQEHKYYDVFTSEGPLSKNQRNYNAEVDYKTMRTNDPNFPHISRYYHGQE